MLCVILVVILIILYFIAYRFKSAMGVMAALPGATPLLPYLTVLRTLNRQISDDALFSYCAFKAHQSLTLSNE